MDKTTQISHSWEEVIVNFFENKVRKSSLYKAREFVDEKEREIKSEANDKKRNELIKSKEKKYHELIQLRKNAPSTEIRSWIEETSKKSLSDDVKIIKATHLLRFGHSSSSSDGIFLSDKSKDLLLTTASLKKNVIHDIAHNNGNLITISRFLALSHLGNIIIDLILDDVFSFLKPFSENDNQLSRWIAGFRQLVAKRDIKTADKAKQIYFPLKNKTEKYHLLTPLFSSTLAEEIYLVQAHIKYSDESSTIRKAIYDKDADTSKYHRTKSISYPNLAVQKFGGSQPQNVSMLNKGRTWKANPKDKTPWGVTYLFSSAPPIWQSQRKPPTYQYSFFDSKLQHVVSEDDIAYLRDFLIRFDKIDLSIKDPKRKKWIDEWVGRIVDKVLAYAASIQHMEPGWSATEGIRLKYEHQLFLDPCRKDEAFQAARKANDWQAIVCQDFARWLNKTLVGKEKQFSPQQEHTRMWVSLIKDPLREYDELMCLEIKTEGADA